MAIQSTQYKLPGQTAFYKGKVRDVYTIGEDTLVMVVTDRISAFDVVLPQPIPFKGQVLNQIAASFLEATKDIVPNWVEAVPDPNVTIGKRCEPFKVEMVIRGYLAGHAWRTYRSGSRELCGVTFPDGLKQNQQLPKPVITPTTKAEHGKHDEDISREEIIAQGIVREEEYIQLEDLTRKLYARGQEIAREKGLILVDTKYEFGKIGNQIYLLDEIHTPDSSRYFYLEGFEERLANNEPQKQLSKEFVREWLIANGFMGQPGQEVPYMSPEKVQSISDRYVELYESITGQKFVKGDQNNILDRVEQNILKYLRK